MGLETITVGGMSVPKQEFGLVTAAAWEGDGINTGLMGLAYPALTSAFKGTDPSKDQFPQTQVTYNPIFFTAVQQGIVSNPCAFPFSLLDTFHLLVHSQSSPSHLEEEPSTKKRMTSSTRALDRLHSEVYLTSPLLRPL